MTARSWTFAYGVMITFGMASPRVGHLTDLLRLGAAGRSHEHLALCLLVNPSHGYTGRPLHVRVDLANEDRLAPGEYGAELTVEGPAGTVWKKSVALRIAPETTLPSLTRSLSRISPSRDLRPAPTVYLLI